MSRTFAGGAATDRVVGSAMGWNIASDVTIGAWIKPTSTAFGDFLRLELSGNGQLMTFDWGETLSCITARAIHGTTNAVSTTSTTFSASSWYLIIVTYTVSDHKLRIYYGTETSTTMTEAAYTTQTAGAGTWNATADHYTVGNRGAADECITGSVAHVFGAQTVMGSTAQNGLVSGDVDQIRNLTNLKFYVPLTSPTSTENPDYSGNGYNGTTTGATAGANPSNSIGWHPQYASRNQLFALLAS